MTRRAPVAAWIVGAVFALLLAGGLTPSADDGAIVIRAQRIFTITNGIIENGQILVQNGKIAAIGPTVAVPPGAREYTAYAVTPGFIDAHTHVTLNRGGRGGDPGYTTADTKTSDQFRFADPAHRKIVEGGVTTLLVSGSGGGQVFLAQCLAVKLKQAPRDQMILKEYALLKLYQRQGVGGHFLSSMGWAAIVRSEFLKARDYLQRWDDFKQGRTTTRPAVDPRMESLAVVLRGDAALHVHAHWPSEILTVVNVAREFGIKVTIVHGNYSYRIARELAEYGAIPILGPSLIHMYYDENTPHNAAALLTAAGVTVALNTDLSGEGVKSFFEEAQLLVRHGLKEEDALRAVTLNGAKAIGMESRVGSLEVGKDADLVLLDGDPFDLTRDVTHVFIDGALQFELKEKPQKAKLASVGPFTPFASATPADARQIAIVNGTVLTMAGEPIPGGTVVVDNGKITAVGPKLPVPPGYARIDAGGRVVMPGIVLARVLPTGYVSPWYGNTRTIDTNDEATEPFTPDSDARYNIDPAMHSWRLLRELGITTFHVTPGNGNVIGGAGVVVKPVGSSFTEMLRDPEPKAMVFGLGRAARGRWGNARLEQGGLELMVYQMLDRAAAYKQQRASNTGLARDLKLEALIPVLDGKVLAIFDVDSVDEIRAAIRIVDRYHLRAALSSATEAWKLIDDIKKRNIPVILGNTGEGWTIGQAIRGGVPGYNERMPVMLANAGIKVALYGPGAHRGDLPIGKLGAEPALNAAWCFRNGMTETDALKMITINSAEVAGVGDRLGSLEPGKIADVVIMNGHPLSLRSLPEMVLIDGRVVYQRPPTPAAPRKTIEP